jgi:hypothetical protein
VAALSTAGTAGSVLEAALRCGLLTWVDHLKNFLAFFLQDGRFSKQTPTLAIRGFPDLSFDLDQISDAAFDGASRARHGAKAVNRGRTEPAEDWNFTWHQLLSD